LPRRMLMVLRPLGFPSKRCANARMNRTRGAACSETIQSKGIHSGP
jgi:hypothetical protein